MRENIKYMLKNWIAWDKKSLLNGFHSFDEHLIHLM